VPGEAHRPSSVQGGGRAARRCLQPGQQGIRHPLRPQISGRQKQEDPEAGAPPGPRGSVLGGHAISVSAAPLRTFPRTRRCPVGSHGSKRARVSGSVQGGCREVRPRLRRDQPCSSSPVDLLRGIQAQGGLDEDIRRMRLDGTLSPTGCSFPGIAVGAPGPRPVPWASSGPVALAH
jgi:hypothetical protein